MDRLTNKKTADELRHNIAGLIAAGIEPSALDIRYVKLADYEDEEELRISRLDDISGEDWYE